MSEFKFFALGGLGEDGKNMYCIETEDDILVLDAGLKYPPSTMFGINTIVADFSYLLKNKKKLRGILISHGHDDQIGGLRIIAQELPWIRIFTTGIATNFVKRTLVGTDYDLKNITTYNPKNKLKIGPFTVDFAQVCHNSIDNHMMFIKYKEESIVYATDLIMAHDESPAFTTDRKRINELANEHNTTLLALEAIGSSINDSIAPKHKIRQYLEDDALLHPGRMFVAIYEQNILYANDIIANAKKFGRKVIFYGETFSKVMNEVITRGVVDKNGLILGNFKDIEKETNAIVIIAGNSERLFSKIASICDGGVKEIKFRDGDLFINAAPAFDGGEVRVSKMMDAVAKTGIKIKSLPFKQILPTHAGIEDIKQIVDIINPKNIVAIKGGWKALTLFKEELSKYYNPENIFTVNNGDVLHFQNGVRNKKKQTVEVSEILTQTTGTGEIVNAVLDDRERLAKAGIVLIAAAVSPKGEQIGNIDVSIRGISIENKEFTIKAIEKIATKEIMNKSSEGSTKVRIGIRNKVQRYLMKNHNKQSQVLTVVSTINTEKAKG